MGLNEQKLKSNTRYIFVLQERSQSYKYLKMKYTRKNWEKEKKRKSTNSGFILLFLNN